MIEKVSFLFWNLQKKSLTNLVTAICQQHDIDVVILAECTIPSVTLLAHLNAARSGGFVQITQPTSIVQILVKFPPESISGVRDQARTFAFRLQPPQGREVIIVAAHLPSKMWADDTDQLLSAADFVEEIETAEEEAAHWRTIVCGDFNMSPFEAGMVSAGAFHSVMTRDEAVRVDRRVNRKRHRFFYNPMWSLLGDGSKGPAGSYYRRSSSRKAYFWHMFDQVIIRPDLLPEFDTGDVEVLTQVGSTDLLNAERVPDPAIGSDHLPLVFRLTM